MLVTYTLKDVGKERYTHLLVNETYTTKREYLLLGYIEKYSSQVNTKYIYKKKSSANYILTKHC